MSTEVTPGVDLQLNGVKRDKTDKILIKHKYDLRIQPVGQATADILILNEHIHGNIILLTQKWYELKTYALEEK